MKPGPRSDPPVWASPPEAVAAALGVEPAVGLPADEVARRLEQHGPNALRGHASTPWWRVLLRQLAGLLVLLLAGAAALAFAFGDLVEGVAILVVIALNTAIGFATELRAVRSMEALRHLGDVRALVRRGGVEREIRAAELVPGDLVLLREGQVVTADVRLLSSARLQVAEAALTGESLPVEKAAAPIAPDAVLAERAPMLFKGTHISRGTGEGVVVATGMDTELGRISSLIASADDESTPLQERLDRLGRRLVYVTLGLAVGLVGLGTLRGDDLVFALEMAIALAVATVPEGLPIVATLALARGMWRMAGRNALVARLAGVETLGATTVILTDKTGTLTENQMAVVSLVLPDGAVSLTGDASAPDASSPVDHARLRALTLAALCNDGALHADGTEVGDPTETALLRAARAAGLERDALREHHPRVRELPFESAAKRMATWHADGDGALLVVKGAPDAVLPACTAEWTPDGPRALDETRRARWQEHTHALAADGLRVLGIAERRDPDPAGDPYERLVLVGLIALHDPPRAEVPAAIAACRRAGIRVVMVTGDHPVTAKAIALATGLIDDDGAPVVHGADLSAVEALDGAEKEALRGVRMLARVSPEQKLDLIALHQEAGEVVAMLGDGVNDAPALQQADIGVAMGLRGTQVAREAADMVLRDDRLASVVSAIEQGRVIYRNIRQFVVYLLSCNASEVLVIALATAANAPLPLLPLQILYLNLVTDVFPALALGVGDTDEDVLGQPPRPPDEPLLTGAHWLTIGAWSTWLAAITLAAFGWSLWSGHSEAAARSTAFLTMASTQVAHVFGMASPTAGLFRNEVTRNRWVWAAALTCALLIAATVAIPGLSTVLGVASPEPDGYTAIGIAVVATLALGLVTRRVRRGWMRAAGA